MCIRDSLKHAFAGNDAWILSYRDECFDQIGLKPSVKVELYNGALECQFRKYQLFDGKYKAFRSEGEKLHKTEKTFKPRKAFKPVEKKGRPFTRKPYGTALNQENEDGFYRRPQKRKD